MLSAATNEKFHGTADQSLVAASSHHGGTPSTELETLLNLLSSRLLRAVIAVCALALAPLAHAWPDKPVKLIVPGPPGGNIDAIARLYADFLSRETSQTVIVENRSGGGGSIGVQAVLSAPPDGHTILFTNSNVLTETPHVMKPAYNLAKDLRPIATLAQFRRVLVVGPKVPANDMAGLARHLKDVSGKGFYASSSAGTLAHIGGELLNRRLGADLQHVPFTGSPPALMAVMSGDVDMYLDGVVTATPLIMTGKLKAVGIAGTTRFNGLPQVPTFAEQGYGEFADFSNWMGVVLASKVQGPAADTLYALTRKIAATPQFSARIVEMGFEPVQPSSPQQFSTILQQEFKQNGELVNKLNIKL